MSEQPFSYTIAYTYYLNDKIKAQIDRINLKEDVTKKLHEIRKELIKNIIDEINEKEVDQEIKE